ncbi:S8 family serine peptidase [Aquabacter spiritensis]|uniref:Proprotein convertase P-domain-containing protein n=1 Tax=Aquabacter spiritensis TaxID=933073 RepID=A0A4R3LXW4_9HYPH|nr:S8 family serine peptidase [Aquabacter spiritensis]TCT05490.1 proprotein convertase P-domain-containing protein [Aquabacter spiritensis]
MTTRYIPSDPLFAQQWHLYNWGQDIYGLPQAPGAYRYDINVTGVWPDYTGTGVVVGVLDGGFQPKHPDLEANYLLAPSEAYFSSDKRAIDRSHGVAAIGLVIAAENDVGGVGVAYGADGIGYTHFSEVTSFIRASTYMLLDGVDVNSNSWGLPGPHTLLQRQAFETALVNLVELGRSGLGTVSLFAAGNERTSHSDTNGNPSSSSPYGITIAAASIDGTVTSYSTPGASILVAAPGSGFDTALNAKEVQSIVTTDLIGADGYNKTAGEAGNYTNILGSGFSGTSAATPIVSGVVALMLEANPNLGYRDVQEILAYSARSPDAVGSWSTNGATDWNGGGHRYNHDLGFGLVDALAAVRLAETWQKQSTYGNLVTQTASFPADDPFAGMSRVEAGATATFRVQIEASIRVQHAVVRLSHEPVGPTLQGVTVTLTGPDGRTTSTLLNAATAIDASAGVFVFDTVHDWGQSSVGEWTLTIANNSSQALEIASTLNLLGDTPTAGETFIYTDAYGDLAGAESARAVLDAASPGPHTLNAAAVTFDTTIDLSQHMATIAGVATTIGSSMVFASLITGDGNDTLVGDAGDTTVFSGRGINTVDGGAGADTLWLLKGVGEYVQAGYGTEIVLYGAASQDILTGIEALKFADGTLTFGTDPMVNEVFYAFRNPDLFAAGVVADVHYADVGWREGLDPNAWFDTSAYLAKNPDVAAAGINPLVHFEQNGWWEGRDPSVNFDVSLYLAFNPDVAAAGMDPLLHYLQYGIVEGRQTSMVVDGAHLQGDFDATYYLLANSDVALAGVDAFTHYQQYGWKEGRRADAYFDTSFYLAQNADVAAAGINPLTHFETYGWHEGRNPSQDFDTSAYLAAYADVAAAGIDPLEHYLRYGLEEGRSSFAWDLV